nr:phosphatase PAP2 family protein [uncultured Tyzzerella sp.]
MDTIFNFDKSVILYMNDTISNYPIIKDMFSFITHLGDAGLIWIAFGIFLIIKKSTRKNGIIMLFSLILGSIIGNGILKHIFERPRPFIELSLIPFIAPPGGFSFPSGHSMSSFIGATCIYYTNKKWGIIAYILALLIALSRVILLVHYPTDVLTGALLGIIVALFVITIFKHKVLNFNNKNN